MNIAMSHIFNNALQQVSSQYIPLININIKATLSALFDESFPLETREISDVVKFNSSSISTLLNDILSTVVAINSELPNFFVSVVLVAIFSKLYSKGSSSDVFNKMMLLLKNVLLFNAFCYFVFFSIRAFLLVLPMYYQTKHWLNPIIRAFFLSNDSVWNSLITSLLFLVVFAVLHAFGLSSSTSKNNSEVVILTYVVACFSWVLLEVEDFALLIVCLEGFSLSLYILATTGRTYGSISAAVKYFVFGTLGSIFLYWGSLCVFETLGTMQLDAVKELTSFVNSNTSFSKDSSKLIWAQTLILLGFLVKLGAAPMHQWVADVYSGAPIFITAFYSTFIKLVLFVLFLRFATSFTSTKEIEYAAIFSLIIGCFGTLRQVEVKRFLAYSSITHTGYLLMGDLTAAYVYLVTYLLASLMVFSVLINLKLNSKEVIYLTDLRFVGQLNTPMPRVILTTSLASMAGLPPFAGFYGKMAVWTSLIEDIYLFNDFWSYTLFAANILTSLIAMFYYMQVMCILFVNNEAIKKDLVTYSKSETLFYIQSVGVLLLTLWTFLMPSFLNLLLTSV